jgi:Zn-dependent peptidase ImmA (M78 family)
MSRWAESALRASVIFITGMGGDRQRFILSHEFGHVLLHTRRCVQDVDEREHEADQFAGALLLPEPVARASVSDSLTLQGYMKIKATYGISMAATITRGRHLGLTSRDRQRSLMIQISSRGRRTDEPVRVKAESPMSSDNANRSRPTAVS